MNTINKSELPNIGTSMAGGFYAGLFAIGAEKYALIVSPRSAGGDHDGERWGDMHTKIAATSCFDGMANTVAMADAGYPLATWARGLTIGGYDDWYLSCRDELEICYRNLKPTARENYCNFRDGDNASSIPAGYPYTESDPTKTIATAFSEGGTEAFDSAWYWTSTQSSASNAFIQDFGVGTQDGTGKGSHLRARAVRRLLVIE